MPSLRTVLLGPRYSAFQRNLGLLFALAIFPGSLAAYATGLFAPAGGVIFLPGEATLLGFIAAALVGFERGGFLFAWVAHYAAYLGFRADWAFLSLPSHDLRGQLVFMFDVGDLVVYAVLGLVVSGLGFGLGYLARWGLGRLRGGEPLRDAAD
jgi:hypothetical protein